MKVLANFLSGVFHPLLLPTYVFSSLFIFFPQTISRLNPSFYLTLFVLIVVTTCILPALTVLALYKLQLVKKVSIENRQDRFAPQIIACIIYSFMTWLFYTRLFQIPFMYILMGSMTLCIIIVTAINFYWKISAHSTAMGGFVSFLAFCTYFLGQETLLPYLGLSIIIAGCVMSSRLYLNVHTPLQVCAGFMVGLLTGIGVLSNIS